MLCVTRVGDIDIHVQKYRWEKEMSLKELSMLSGVSASHIHYIENGVRIPSIAILCKLSKALGVPCEKLYSSNV